MGRERKMARWFMTVTLVLAWGCGGDAPVSGDDLAMGGRVVDSLPMGAGHLDLSFDHLFDGSALTLGTAHESATGARVQVDTLRYWVSNVVLVNTDGELYRFPSAFYLVEQTQANDRTTIALDGVPDGVYTTLRLGIGVDADHNHSLDLFEGELSTELDMHWDWSTGFIFLKVEGTHGPTGPEEEFAIHIGNDAMYQPVSIPLDGFAIAEGAPAAVRLRVDLAPVFDQFDFSENNHVIGGAVSSPAEAAISRFAAGISRVGE